VNFLLGFFIGGLMVVVFFVVGIGMGLFFGVINMFFVVVIWLLFFVMMLGLMFIVIGWDRMVLVS